MTDPVREAFERWYLTRGNIIYLERSDKGDYYLYQSTEDAWKTWQAATEAMSQWQTIDTAPVHEPVLVCGSKRLGITVAYKDVHGDWLISTSFTPDNIYPPTHWMPLPANPTNEQEG